MKLSRKVMRIKHLSSVQRDGEFTLLNNNKINKSSGMATIRIHHPSTASFFWYQKNHTLVCWTGCGISLRTSHILQIQQANLQIYSHKLLLTMAETCLLLKIPLTIILFKCLYLKRVGYFKSQWAIWQL